MNVLDPSTDFGARATRRLNEEIIGWLTTVSPSGQPQPVPVWFLWDGDRVDPPLLEPRQAEARRTSTGTRRLASASTATGWAATSSSCSGVRA